MRFIDPAGRRLNRSDDSVGVIDNPMVFVSWPSFESVLTHQRGFWIRVALILLVYFRTRTWSGPIRVLIVIGLVLFSVCFLELLSLFTASLSDLIQSRASNSRTEFNDALASTKLLSAWILVPSTKPALTHCATTRLKSATKTS
jgi:hypothetical protein